MAIGGGVVALLIVIVIARSCMGGGDGGGRSDAGACLEDLAAHIPAGATTLSGSDLILARAQGFEDGGSLDRIADSKVETGAIPSAVTYEFSLKNAISAERALAQTGVSAGDIECSLNAGGTAVMSGSFDPAQVEGSDAGSRGRLAASPDLLALSSGRPQPASLLEPAKGESIGSNDAVIDVLGELREAGAYSVIVQIGGGEGNEPLAAGVGSANGDDGRSVTLAWAFADDDAAKSGRPAIVDRVNSTLQGYVSIRESDLEVDGSMVSAVIPTTRAPDLLSLLDDPTFKLVTAPS